MKNRLELFRKQIAAFDGAADPTGAIRKGYIIEEPYQSSTNTLFKRISLRPQSKNLLIGGIGLGKTTQILKLFQIFQENPDIGIFPLYIDVSEYTRPNDIQVGTLDTIIGLELINLFENASENYGLKVDESRKKIIQEFAYGSTVTQSERSLFEQLKNSEALSILKTPSSKGVLSSYTRLTNLSTRLVQVLSSLLKDFQTKFKQTSYFLFDGLDRVDEVEKVTQAASLDLLNSGIGFLIAGAASLLYSRFINSIDNIFNHIEYRSAFDVERYEEAYLFFRTVLLARADKNFFQTDALNDLIILSGGVLRDLINLTQESIQEAYLNDTEIVEREHVEKAMLSMGRVKILCLNKEQDTTLKKLTESTLVTPTSPEEIYLLSSGRILEYGFPERRFDLHPVIRQFVV
ncbi:hypothetical protein [Scytonema sp. NUACC26]|uniref:hypothetical protein n=1 Tax=Scytonema sp. NUACC26 TaxID=3140176 RepID=UPI0034DBF18A